jgi:HEAT repeat protein
VGLAVIAVIIATAVLQTPPEPRWNGRTVSEWLLRLDLYQSELRQSGGFLGMGSRVSRGPAAAESPEEQRRRMAEARSELEFAKEALRQMGTNGLPVMGRMLEAMDSNVRREMVGWIQRQSWIRWQPRLDHEWQQIGGEGFKIVHDEAVPDLLSRLKAGNPAGRRNAALLLGEIQTRGPTVIPRLAMAMRDPDHTVRVFAAQALARWGLGPVETWIEALSIPEAGMRGIAAEALSRMGRRADQARPDLLKLLADAEVEVQTAAVQALGSMGEGSDGFVDFLLTGMNGNRQETYVRALGEAGPSATKAMPRLWEMVESETTENELRERALEALGKIAGRVPVDATFIERVAGFVAVEGFGSTAVEALGRLGPRGVPALLRVLETGSERPDVIEKTLEILFDSGFDVGDALPLLLRWADDPNDEIARAAVRVLEQLPRARSPQMVGALEGASPSQWCVLARILGSREVRDERLVEVLLEALEDPALASTAAEVLGKLQADPGRAIPALVRCVESALLKNDQPADPELGISWGETPPSTAGGTPAATEVRFMGSGLEMKVRVAAIDAIGRYGPGAASAVGFLKGLVGAGAGPGAWEAPSGPVSPLGGTPAVTTEEAGILALRAAGALARIEPGSAEIRPVLDHTLRHGTVVQQVFAVDLVKDTELDGRFAVPGLLEVLKGKELWARVRAMEALGKVGPAAEEAVPELLEMIGDASWSGYSESVGLALARIGEPAVPGLMGLLAVPEKRRAVLGVLHQMAPAGGRACPRVADLLSDPDAEVRRMACRCLMAMGTHAISVQPGLVHRSEGSSGEPGILAALALSVVDPSNARALARTVEALRDERDAIREMAVLALRLRRPLPVETVSDLLGVLNGPFESGGVRREVLETLGVMIPRSPDALGALIRATREDDEWVALAAVRALGEAGPSAREAVPTLRRLLEPGSGWRHGRQDVLDALAKIDPASPSVGGV